jgi:hypothetical protein
MQPACLIVNQKNQWIDFMPEVENELVLDGSGTPMAVAA